mgnify:CR=1 FL=1
MVALTEMLNGSDVPPMGAACSRAEYDARLDAAASQPETDEFTPPTAGEVQRAKHLWTHIVALGLDRHLDPDDVEADVNGGVSLTFRAHEEYQRFAWLSIGLRRNGALVLQTPGERNQSLSDCYHDLLRVAASHVAAKVPTCRPAPR